MTVKRLIEHLTQMNPDYEIELTKVLSVASDDTEGFEIRLDHPIIGMASSDETKEVCLVIEHGPTIAHFSSNITKLE